MKICPIATEGLTLLRLFLTPPSVRFSFAFLGILRAITILQQFVVGSLTLRDGLFLRSARL